MFPVLKGERVTLRAFTKEDIPNLVNYLDNFKVSSMLNPVPHPYSIADAEDWVAFTASSDMDDTINWAIDDGTGLIGAIGLSGLRGDNSFGYWLGQPFWGRGYASEAGRAVLKFCFAHYPELHELNSYAFRENQASQNVLGKLGFLRTGEATRTSKARPDEQIPSVTFALTRKRYLAEKLDI
ncbi:GNAT family N-acetyltransferase [Pseudovibrio exalbescens]|uniref:GNAT family N-acetyltransferase n=1 Tax=Pseudovibrio exalbescens TaxID=197461 RepID=UPI0023669D44|nr:GNAT family N-acetyltransferase [Pseudovibrio exalbescens]MDD7909828.1 GNAT family N-acetyltransferase [Pseudovibrio exalbescens]